MSFCTSELGTLLPCGPEGSFDILQIVFWPEVRAVVIRRRFWLQQDGATAHTAVRAREWLERKFGH